MPPPYYTIEDRDEFAIFACREEQHIRDYVEENSHLIDGETEYILCIYDSIESIVPLNVQPLKRYIDALRTPKKV